MCKYCKGVTSVKDYYPRTLDKKTVDFGVMGKGELYLGMDCDIETETYRLTSEIDLYYPDRYVFASREIKFCPFCGEELITRDE